MHLSKCFILITIILLSFSPDSDAQHLITLGPSVSAGTNTFAENGKLGVGGNLTYQYQMNRKGGIRLSGGYDFFKQRYPGVEEMTIMDSIKKTGIDSRNLSFIPVRIGYSQYLHNNDFFLFAEAGVARLIARYDDYTSTYTDNILSVAFGGGYSISLNDSQIIDVVVSYNYNRLNENSNKNYVRITAAYGFSLK